MAAIALLVGGIGIMNIMLVTVKEHAKSASASAGCGEHHILGQLLAEALFRAVRRIFTSLLAYADPACRRHTGIQTEVSSHGGVAQRCSPRRGHRVWPEPATRRPSSARWRRCGTNSASPNIPCPCARGWCQGLFVFLSSHELTVPGKAYRLKSITSDEMR